MPLHDPIENLCSGSVLVRCDAGLPQSVKVSGPLVMEGWRLVSDIGTAQLDRQLDQEGWYFFYLPPEIAFSAFGFARKHALARALKKLLARAETEKLNTVKVTAVETKKFLGVHHAKVIARVRHIQKSPILFATPEDRSQQTRSIAA